MSDVASAVSPHAQRSLLVLLSTLALLLVGCGDDDGNGGSSGSGGSGGSMDSSIAMDACDCGDDDAGDAGTGGMDAAITPPTFTKPALLMAAGLCATTSYAEFETAASRLVQTTDAYAQTKTTEHKLAAQGAFRDAMGAWQRAEIFAFGPAARSTEPGGQGLRDQIYFFPSTNRCLIDQQLVNQRYAQDNYATALASSRGLSAIEYLLFYEGADNACGAQVSINVSGSWAALSESEITQRRADYAHAAASDVLSRAQTLTQAWAPNGGGFIGQFTAPGAGGTYATEQDALNALVGAAFYVERMIKDAKLSIPLSIPLSGVITCTNAPATCPALLESPYARISLDNIRQNLIALRHVIQGCGTGFDGLGIDDWLRSIDEGELADALLAAIDHADDTANALDSLETAIEEVPPTRALELHAAIKAITDLFKTELAMVLNVPLPGTGPGGDVD